MSPKSEDVKLQRLRGKKRNRGKIIGSLDVTEKRDEVRDKVGGGDTS